jgi:hypothetical protein
MTFKEGKMSYGSMLLKFLELGEITVHHYKRVL